MDFRTITILGSLQAILIVAGVICLGITMYINGYPKHHYLVWSDTALFLRHYGFWLILVPLGWTAFAIKYKDHSFDREKAAYISGITINCIIILLFGAATLSARHPLIIAL